jgi:hypothetical protein
MYLDTIFGSTKFRPDRTSNMAPWQLTAILENKLSAITPDLMAGLSPNFNHRYCKDTRHNTGVSDLTYFSRSKLKMSPLVGMYCDYLT